MRLELIYEPYNFEEKENWLPPSDSRYCQIHNDSMILQLCNSLDVCVNFEIHLRSTRAHWRHPATENLMKNQNMYDRVPDCVEVVTFVLTFFQLLDIFKIFLISNIFLELCLRTTIVRLRKYSFYFIIVGWIYCKWMFFYSFWWNAISFWFNSCFCLLF